MQLPEDDLENVHQMLSEAADFLLPVARASSWPCRLELVAWLIAVRDTCKEKGDQIH